jgi:hypothetical protein
MFAPWGGISGRPLTGCVSYSKGSGRVSMDASLCACFDVLVEGVGLAWAISPFHNASNIALSSAGRTTPVFFPSTTSESLVVIRESVIHPLTIER